MASDPVRLQPVRAALAGRSFGIWPLLLVPLLIASALVARAASFEPANVNRLIGAVGTMTPEDLTETAASELDQALSMGGSGITFEIIQRQTVRTREGGQPIEIVDPQDPTKTITVDEYVVGTLVERGLATADGFWSEILVGPQPGSDPDKYDADKAETRRSALVRDGKAWRDDGEGWRAADLLPGIGLDPTTVAALPALLSGSDDARDAEPAAPDAWADLPGLRQPEIARSLITDVTPAELPGVIAADAAAFTEIGQPARLAFDDAGRLVAMTVVARNTSMRGYDLIVETAYTFAYPGSPPDLPRPEPRAESAPADEGAAS